MILQDVTVEGLEVSGLCEAPLEINEHCRS